LVYPALIGFQKHAGMHAHAFRHFYGYHFTENRRIWIVRPHEVPTTILQSGGIENMDITRSGSQPSGKGPAEYFTGAVRIDPLFEAPDPARAVGASVTFEPGARTAWHSHPLGQTLIVTAGRGRVQRWGGPIEEIGPGEKHWHGATPTTAMTHIAIVERIDGKTADWMEKVSDEQYRTAEE